MSLRIFVRNQSYRSHARAARAYIRIFDALPDSLACLVEDPNKANVCYLHTEPDRIAGVLADYPNLQRTYKIGYCVWETDIIPPDFVANLALLDEVWTASFYNWVSLSRVHPRVHWVPHVTDGLPRPEPNDIAELTHALGIESGDFCYLFIGKDEPRKNVTGLRDAFHYVHQRRPHTRLIVKTQGDSDAQQVSFEGQTALCHGSYTDSQIAALYALCDAYVSPHRSEGWGLTLSDAMGYHRLCIATAHSGNMDFMTAANSLPVSCTVAPVREEHRYTRMREGMQWAYPHPESLERQMIAAYDMITSGQAQPLLARAARDIRCFDARHVRVLMRHRLRHIARQLNVAHALI